jgi:hypothetical protein
MPKNSKGTTLLVAVATVLTPISHVLNVDGPNPETQYVDDTHLESDHVEDGELAGLSTVGEVSAEILYDWTNTVHKQLITDVISGGVIRDFKIGFPPDGEDGYEFEGSVKSCPVKFASKERVKASLSIKLRTHAELTT